MIIDTMEKNSMLAFSDLSEQAFINTPRTICKNIELFPFFITDEFVELNGYLCENKIDHQFLGNHYFYIKDCDLNSDITTKLAILIRLMTCTSGINFLIYNDNYGQKLFFQKSIINRVQQDYLIIGTYIDTNGKITNDYMTGVNSL